MGWFKRTQDEPKVSEGTIDLTSLTVDQVKPILESICQQYIGRVKQDFSANLEQTIEKEIIEYKALVARKSWHSAQQWCKWSDSGPVLMPDYNRIYYRKGQTELLVLEYAPQVRTVKFLGSVVDRENRQEKMDKDDPDYNKVYSYTLAFPFMVFVMRFVAGLFAEVRVSFNDRPLRQLKEKPLRPYLSNIDPSLKLCEGHDFDRESLERGNISQQAAFVLSHFWQTKFSSDWSEHFWDSKTHFGQTDPRLASLDAWQQATAEDPLFVIDDVEWLPSTAHDYGSMIVQMVEADTEDQRFQEELYDSLTKNFLNEVTKQVVEQVAQFEKNTHTLDGLSVALIDGLRNLANPKT